MVETFYCSLGVATGCEDTAHTPGGLPAGWHQDDAVGCLCCGPCGARVLSGEVTVQRHRIRSGMAYAVVATRPSPYSRDMLDTCRTETPAQSWDEPAVSTPLADMQPTGELQTLPFLIPKTMTAEEQEIWDGLLRPDNREPSE